MQSANTIILGASAAGLSNAACLKKAGVDFILLEKQPHIANAWRNHYERLHLHTNKSNSKLPFVPFDASLPTYPSRQDVVDYLENYAQKMDIRPVFNAEVQSVRRENGHWITRTADGKTYQSENVVVATGATHTPKSAHFKGLESFPGKILHSSEYKNGAAFKGKNVLVVGFGNSGCEQAIDLHEHGAKPSMSVRSAVNVIPRDVFGISILQLGLTMRWMPPAIVDALNAPLLRFLVGDFTKFGLKKAADGPVAQIAKTGRIPLLDIGTIQLMREGHIQVFGDIEKIEGNKVFFENGKSGEFDALVLATGYVHNLEKMIAMDQNTLEDLKKPLGSRSSSGQNGLYFCGFYISPNGMLREIGIEAKAIARQILERQSPRP